jgi:hypothetical protein
MQISKSIIFSLIGCIVGGLFAASLLFSPFGGNVYWPAAYKPFLLFNVVPIILLFTVGQKKLEVFFSYFISEAIMFGIIFYILKFYL